MRRLAVGTIIAAIGGLLTYEVVALILSVLAIVLGLVLLWRQRNQNDRLDKIEARLEARADALGDALREDLGG